MKQVRGAVAVITGAGGGVGRALAEHIAARGGALALVDIQESTLQEVSQSIAGHGVTVSTHVADVSREDDMRALAEAIADRHDGRINLLINNAGITYQKSFATHSLEDWQRIVGINWWGVLHGCHYFLPLLRAAAARGEDAHIINMASMSATTGLPNQSSYCATKSAVHLLSLSMWGELRTEGIGVTSVQPGAIRTDMIKATLAQSDDLVAAERNYHLAQRIGVSAETVAKRIIKAFERDSLRIRIGADAVAMDLIKRLVPVTLQKLLKSVA
jgi:short-subunit dehydrogenase